MFEIQPISDLDLAFPAQVKHLMPKSADIPPEFSDHGNVWNRLVSDWFYSGLSSLDLTPKEGVDKSSALRHIRAIMGSFEPKHEDKMASCAFLLSEWFTNPKWTAKSRSRVG